MNQEIQNIIEGFDGVMALSFIRKDGTVLEECNSSLPLSIASVGKLFILGTLLEKCQKEPEQYSLHHRITLGREDQVGGSGLLQYLSEGLEMTIRDLVVMMMIVSDNVGTNQILAYIGDPEGVCNHREENTDDNEGVSPEPLYRLGDRIQGKRGLWYREASQKGAEAVKKHLSSLGIMNSGVLRRIAVTDDELEGGFALGCTDEMTAYLVAIENGKVLDEAYLAVFNEILKDQQFKNMLLRHMKLADFTEEELPGLLQAGSKTGYDGDRRADCGWICTESGEMYLYAIIANGGRDTRYSMDNEAEMAMAAIGRILEREYLT
ncbi:MAG: serine hydrolase [Lachnospiraceae bacterium]|nr:serine hydrolase [Lachnospiraceae bacterium]